MLDLHFLQEGQTVLIAYHLYKRCFSIRDAATKRVLGYAESIVVSDVSFIVRQHGRAKVLRERMKNVHAFVQGRYWAGLQCFCTPELFECEAYYNPYRTDSFVNKGTAVSIRHAQVALCADKRVYYS